MLLVTRITRMLNYLLLLDIEAITKLKQQNFFNIKNDFPIKTTNFQT